MTRTDLSSASLPCSFQPLKRRSYTHAKDAPQAGSTNMRWSSANRSHAKTASWSLHTWLIILCLWVHSIALAATVLAPRLLAILFWWQRKNVLKYYVIIIRLVFIGWKGLRANWIPIQGLLCRSVMSWFTILRGRKAEYFEKTLKLGWDDTQFE